MNTNFKKNLTPKEIFEEACKAAVESDSRALGFVPKEFRTEELCKIAVEKDGYALKHVPDELFTEELCKIAVENKSFAIMDVPDELRTEELCEMAKETMMAIEKIKKDYPRGTRVELVRMDYRYAPPIGTKGTVRWVTENGNLAVSWDDGSDSCLEVLYGVDECRKIHG